MDFIKVQTMVQKLEEEIRWLDNAKKTAPEGLVVRLQNLQDKRKAALAAIISTELVLPDVAKEFES